MESQTTDWLAPLISGIAGLLVGVAGYWTATSARKVPFADRLYGQQFESVQRVHSGAIALIQASAVFTEQYAEHVTDTAAQSFVDAKNRFVEQRDQFNDSWRGESYRLPLRSLVVSKYLLDAARTIEFNEHNELEADSDGELTESSRVRLDSEMKPFRDLQLMHSRLIHASREDLKIERYNGHF